ncbi:hypothetical protein [Reichenbachiella sp. MALMAid0571]|uniref:hypothetical protein n=1 Tax=Reichenbachiella sp. MALMAid0571 TaxID=3143939 RepID=UPI0032DF38D1
MNHASLTEPVSGGLNISVISIGPEYSLSDPIWAINWFDVTSKTLYDFYNSIAVSHVTSVKGVPFFKGQLIRRIEGQDADERELLLIVYYPNPESFLTMIKSKIFQLKSILRVWAVKDFTFGFMKRRDDGEIPKLQFHKYDGGLVFLVHHFRNGHTGFDALKLKDIAASYDVFTYFAGIKSHLIGRRRKNDKLKTAPFFMDGLLILAAFEETQFEDMLNSLSYQEFIKENASNYIGLYRREI